MTREVLGALPFTTGADLTGGTTTYRLTFLNQLWMLEAIMAALVLLSDPDNWNDVGTVSPEDAASLCSAMIEVFDPMIGQIFAWASSTGPSYALKCDGTTYNRVDYPELYAVLGSPFIVDANHFKTPDMRGRVIRGSGSVPLGNTGGADTVTLSVANLPAHSHSEVTAVPAVGAAITGIPVPAAVPGVGVTGSAGGGAALDIQPRTIRLDYYIVAK